MTGFREIVFDTETTGMNPSDRHRIIELGCVELIDGHDTGNYLHMYFNPERDIDPGAFEQHGITKEFLSDKPRFKEKVDEIISYFGDAQIVAHNLPFDIKFLDYEFTLARRKILTNERVDTLNLARQKHTGRVSLDALLDRYGIDRSDRKLHGALLDAQLLTQVYWYLLERDKLELGKDTHAAGHLAISDAEQIPENFRHSDKIQNLRIRVSEEEFSLHVAFLEKLKNPLWNQIISNENFN